MKSWSLILATIVIFGAGVITGGLLVNHVKHPAGTHGQMGVTNTTPVAMMPQPLTPEFMKKQFVGQLNDELQLSKEQREQVGKIIAQGQQSTHDLWKLVGPQFQLIWRDTRTQIRQVLTPEQRKEFELLMKEQRRQPQSSSTNAPPVSLQAPTNALPIQPPMPTNGPPA